MKSVTTFLFAFMFIFSGCELEPVAIDYGNQECQHCRMRVSQEVFSAQLLTKQGRSHVYDAIECMAASIENGSFSMDEVHSIWVMDASDPGEWMNAETAVFLQSENYRSPMSLNFSAYATREKAEEFQNEHGGDIISWEELKMRVSEAWL